MSDAYLTALPTDVFHAKYRKLTALETEALAEIKACAARLHGLVEITQSNGRQTRESKLAQTKLEEAVMWAVKGITK